MSFDCLEVAHEAVLSIGAIVRAVARFDRGLADQMRRAAISVVSNIDEAAGNAGARRVQHYRYALGSAREVTSQLRVRITTRTPTPLRRSDSDHLQHASFRGAHRR